GVREAKGEFIAFMDDDCEPDAHWLSRLHGAMMKNEWAAVGGNVFPAEEFDPPVTYSPDLAWAVGCNPPGFFSSLAGRLHLPNTSSLMAERELLLRLPFQTVAAKKGDDEEGSWSYETGREDAQWWRAVRLAGERCGVAPRAIVWHHISADRFDRDVIRERIANDGRAHWNRTHNVAEIQDAARDVVNAPFVALREIFLTPHEGARTWEKHLAWALRQAAFINAATNDFDRGISPMARTRTYATEGARVVLSGMKAAARHLARNAFHAFRRTAPVPTMDEPPRRAMVVLHDFLGDAVLALPMLRQLALALDETRITVVTGGVCAPLLRENVAGNVKVVEVPDNARGRNPLACIHLYKFLAAFHPDVVLVAYCHGLAPLPFFLLDHAPVVGWREDNGFGQRTWGDLLAARVRKNFRKAECAALLDLLAPLGIGTSLQRPAVKFSAAAGDRATRIAGKANTRPGEYVVVHFEAGNRWKLWPSEKMAAVVRELLADNVTVFLVGSRRGRVEAERQRLLRLPGCFSLHNDLNSDELAAILGGAALF
ncbi:MAG TPA: glycosyltransferase, partial [Candidatus Sumerlaeota bacterium]|nr:glycosyltransferase [Candidatus Sumerlaeota bacterium]